MTSLRTVRSTVAVLDADDVDTDRIIPARFLTTTQKTGLGSLLFFDWRATEGSPARVLDDARMHGRSILMVGRNFGCGSSREHAPWALTDAGFCAVVARSFADIFRANALKNGLLPVELSPRAWAALRRHLDQHPDAVVQIDIAHQAIRADEGPEATFELDPFARRCLLEGIDELGYLLRFSNAVDEYEQTRRTP